MTIDDPIVSKPQHDASVSSLISGLYESSELAIYPPRTREMNVSLIKNIQQAASEEQYFQRQNEFSENLHPSLFSELDWMERNIQGVEPEQVHSFVDALFLNNLERIILSREPDFHLDGVALSEEIAINRDFYHYIIESAPEIFQVLPDYLAEQIKVSYETDLVLEPESMLPDLIDTQIYQSMAPQIHSGLNAITDRDVLVKAIELELDNATAHCLDHISSRIRAKEFVRGLPEGFPHLQIASMSTMSDEEELMSRLEEYYEKAEQLNLLPVLVVCRVALDFIRDNNVLELTEFGGERAKGYGNCGNCSMMFSSSAIVSLDPNCPFLFEYNEKGKESVFLPLGFNVATCPFCGHKSRVDAPAMFYSSTRKKVLYCTPALEQFSEDQAEEIHGPMIEAIRERFMNRLDEKELADFESAAEEITYDTLSFILAIQTGTTSRIHHAFNRINFAGGASAILDPTTGVIIELLTPTETLRMWDLDDMSGYAVSDQEDIDIDIDEVINVAITAVAIGEYDRAQVLLEDALERDSQNIAVRENLAKVYLAMGDKPSAKRILS